MKRYMTMRYPAAWHGEMWREGAPCGNGTVGALVYGSVAREIVMLNHAQLWRSGKIQEMPDISYTLPKIRGFIENRKPELANNILSNALHKNGYNACTSELFPLGDIIIDRVRTAVQKHYRRTVDMENAEVTVEWQEGETKYKRRLFVSRYDGIVYMQISADKPGMVDIDVTLDVHDRETAGNNPEIINTETKTSDGYIYYAGQNTFAEYVPAKGDYGITMRALCDGGTTGEENGKIVIRGADSVLLTAEVFVGQNRKTAFAEGKERLKKALPYEEALSKHAELHKKFYLAAELKLYSGEYHSNEELLLDAYDGEISNELAETVYAYGRYLFVCSTGDRGELPTHLLGLWAGSYHTTWGFNMLNVNFQMIYRNALSGNMPSLLKNALMYIENFKEDYRENARKIFGCRGILVNAVNTPESGKAACTMSHILNWTAGAAWLCRHFYDYWRYTGDNEFLTEHALPFMAETALFYEDFLYRDDSGKFAFAPATSPENVPANIKNKYGDYMQISKNPSMDIAVTRELFTDLLEGAHSSGRYADKYEKWQEILDGLPDYKLNPDGSLKEWADDFYEDNNAHRHQSHVYAVFPGHSVTPEHDLFSAFYKAEEKRFSEGLSEMSAWGAVYMAGVYARLRDGEKAFISLSETIRNTCANNLFSMCNDWRRMGSIMCGDYRVAPFQIDANIGFPGVVNEMLVNSSTGAIELLPALPGKWSEGSIKGLLCVGGITACIAWNDFSAEVVLIGVKKATQVTCGSGYTFENGETELTVTSDAALRLIKNPLSAGV